MHTCGMLSHDRDSALKEQAWLSKAGIKLGTKHVKLTWSQRPLLMSATKVSTLSTVFSDTLHSACKRA